MRPAMRRVNDAPALTLFALTGLCVPELMRAADLRQLGNGTEVNQLRRCVSVVHGAPLREDCPLEPLPDAAPSCVR